MNHSSYILKNISNNQYGFLLISKDLSRIQDYILIVETELKQLNNKSYILFDLLLSNSIDDRFYTCFFDGNKFALNTLKKVEKNELSKDLLKISSNYYLSHENLFEDLFFTKEYKEYILKNLQQLV